MRVVLACATRRGYRVLEKLIALMPEAALTVFSFREEAHEPPFLDDMRTLAESHGAQFFETRKIGSKHEFWETTAVDLMLVVSWRYLIPAQVYRQPVRGTFVLHDSPLPRYRGFAPTVWAILNGEDHTGVTLFEIADDMDSGDIVAQQRVPIEPDDTIADVIEQVTQTYLSVIEATLPALLDGTAVRTPQDQSLATFTCKRLPEDNQIDWKLPTQTIYNLIRAVTYPYPGAFTSLGGRKLTIWTASPVERRYVGSVPGRVVEISPEGSVVLTGDGALLIRDVQFEGETRAVASTVLNGLSLTLGR
ncbi:MAG TPA: methionyl-tRNA formyltransferase [Phototrophicaceae bacterium]|nr:methionyl-tRNA formyltransferase [Phototrophicaceae bacterium]